MRPIATKQNALQFPLNELLGAPANIRILRALSVAVSSPLSVQEAATICELTSPGARRALKKLVETGFVKQIGNGRTPQYALREDDGLVLALREIFKLEQNRYNDFLVALRTTITEFNEVVVAWVNEWPIEPGRSVHMHLLTDPASTAYLETQLRKRLLTLEKQMERSFEIHVHTKADIPKVEWEEAIMLAGYPMAVKKGESGTHKMREKRALQASQGIAKLLSRDPTLIQRAIQHVELQLSQDQGAAKHDLREWLDILKEYSQQRVIHFLLSKSPRAERLRQSSPFFAVLHAKERERLFVTLEESQ